MENKKLIVGAVIVVAVLAIGGFIFAKSLNQTTTNMPVATATATTSDTSTPSVTTTGSAVEFAIEGGEYYFKPNEIKVKKGDSVKITFNNKGGMHDFVIDELSVRSKLIRSNETTTVEFTAEKTGSFVYYCSVGQHRQLGMKGTLIVE